MLTATFALKYDLYSDKHVGEKKILSKNFNTIMTYNMILFTTKINFSFCKII